MKITLLLIQAFLFNHLLGQNNFNIDPSILRDPTGYKVRYGDSLRINVRGEQECSGEFIINREGKVRLTYIGDVMVVGLNTRAIEALLIKKYQSELIFRNPTINVFVVNYSERVVFLTGSVNRQGPTPSPQKSKQ